MRLVRASILLVALGVYLSAPFQLTPFDSAQGKAPFWSSGLGDWMDPYFINYLLEHWYRSALGWTDPSSPPMFHPTRGTLGYSHGLVLYAPFYIVARLLSVHPFQAYNITILAVIALGSLCLYVVLRRFFHLSFVESFVICAAFLASPNVTDGSLGAWSQRASVFLIPMILLILLISREVMNARSRMALAFVCGLLSTLLFTQDFHTALFALFLTLVALVPALLLLRASTASTLARSWRNEPYAARVALAITAFTILWTLSLSLTGGGGLEIAGLTLTSRDWRRPALVVLVAAIVWLWLRGGIKPSALREWAGPWSVSFAAGSLAGILVFLWIYLDVYRQHRAFPETDLLNALLVRDPSSWHSVSAFWRDLRGYESSGTFAVVLGLIMLGWSANRHVDRRGRLYLLWLLLASVVVLLIPLQLGDFSIWRTVFAPLPGFSAIRDPKRIIYAYELAITLFAGWLLSRFPPRSVVRASALVVLLLGLVVQSHIASFVILRPDATYARWVGAPIQIDPSCQSFYIKPASSAYADRPNSAWTVYHLDAMFIALNQSLPTLNGYSAWAPDGWALGNPQTPGYSSAVRQWIERNGLAGVCALDIETRTMRAEGP